MIKFIRHIFEHYLGSVLAYLLIIAGIAVLLASPINPLTTKLDPSILRTVTSAILIALGVSLSCLQ